jgi:hypothetical protein
VTIPDHDQDNNHQYSVGQVNMLLLLMLVIACLVGTRDECVLFYRMECCSHGALQSREQALEGGNNVEVND